MKLDVKAMKWVREPKQFYYGTDLVGNEIGAVAKNVISIAAGMLDGLECSTLKGA